MLLRKLEIWPLFTDNPSLIEDGFLKVQRVSAPATKWHIAGEWPLTTAQRCGWHCPENTPPAAQGQSKLGHELNA
jgi:hypothetical protein